MTIDAPGDPFDGYDPRDDPNHPDFETTDEVWLAQMFEFEYCGECGKDADRHVVTIDPLGKRHASCLDDPDLPHQGDSGVVLDGD